MDQANPPPRPRHDSRPSLGRNRIRLHLAFKSGDNSRPSPFTRKVPPAEVRENGRESRSPTSAISERDSSAI